MLERAAGQRKAAGIAEPEVKKKPIDLGIEPAPLTPEQFGQLIASAVEKWAKVIKFAGIKAE
jgi:hypothetical protein